MAWQSLSFAYKEVLASTKMNQIQTNLDLLIRTELGGQTITPASAVAGLSIVQNNDEKGINIDSVSASHPAFRTTAKYCYAGIQDILGGYGLKIERNLDEVGVQPLVKFVEDHPSGTQPVLEIQNDGSGNDIVTPNFTLKDGHIAPGGNEALRWDVVELDMDVSEQPESVAYALDGVKCKAMSIIGYDLSEDDILVGGDYTYTAYTYVEHDGTNLIFYYGAWYVDGDDARVIVFTTA